MTKIHIGSHLVHIYCMKSLSKIKSVGKFAYTFVSHLVHYVKCRKDYAKNTIFIEQI